MLFERSIGSSILTSLPCRHNQGLAEYSQSGYDSVIIHKVRHEEKTLYLRSGPRSFCTLVSPAGLILYLVEWLSVLNRRSSSTLVLFSGIIRYSSYAKRC